LANSLLDIQRLSTERDDRLLFSSLSFSVSAGELVQIAGPNGSGKTSLLRILAGLSTRYEGALFWRGEPIEKQRTLFRQQSLYLGHGAGIKAVLSPLENLRWSCAIRGATPSEESLLGALQKVGLAGFERQPCLTLSAGQQRRASLARLFCQPAKLWILDEPFTAIDQRGVKEMESWLVEFCTAGGAVLLTTHHRLETSGARHQIVELGGGNVVA
jgi:heme exporter protein A